MMPRDLFPVVTNATRGLTVYECVFMAAHEKHLRSGVVIFSARQIRSADRLSLKKVDFWSDMSQNGPRGPAGGQMFFRPGRRKCFSARAQKTDSSEVPI